MKFILTEDWNRGIADLTERLVKELTGGKKVLWLVSGGSNIAATVQVANGLPAGLTSTLSVMLIDERYGEPGHPNSNWARLMEAGLSLPLATMISVLESGQDFEATRLAYSHKVTEGLATNDVVIAQIGMGEDGHIAGILPGSSAALAAKRLVVGYERPPYQRLTLTFQAIEQVTAAYVFTFGTSKKPALMQLRDSSPSLVEQPAQILKQLPEAYIYNDQIGGTP